jgi:DNA repair photolyase
MNNDYIYGLLLTQQFRFCGNPFRADTYRGCSFKCKYCFSNIRISDGSKDKNSQITKSNFKIFKDGYDSIDYKTTPKGVFGKLNQELLTHRVPIHLGGLSDPFQPCEFKENNTLEFLKLFKDYPVIISTKTNYIPDDYFEFIDVKTKTFQISLFTDNEETLRTFEPNTPTAKQRIDFIKELKRRGYWVSVRIQPIIYIDEAISLINKLKNIVDYITVEHLKIPPTKYGRELIKLIDMQKLGYILKLRRSYLKLPINEISKNIGQIKKIHNINLGVGDNELLTETTSCNCCGVDCMPKEFNNWMGYNYLNIAKSGHNNHWCPEQNIKTGIINKLDNNNRKIKHYVDKYCTEVYSLNERNLFNQ